MFFKKDLFTENTANKLFVSKDGKFFVKKCSER